MVVATHLNAQHVKLYVTLRAMVSIWGLKFHFQICCSHTVTEFITFNQYSAKVYLLAICIIKV